MIERFSGSFIQPVLTLVSGIALAQVVVFAARPALTRLFTPDEFGVLTLFVTLVAVMASVSTGHFEDAGLLPESKEDAGGLYLMAWGLATLTSLALLVVIPLRSKIAVLFGTPGLGTAVYLIPPGVLLLSWGQVLEGWHSRNDRFGLISGGRITQSGVVVGIQLGAGLMGMGALGLTSGVVAGFGALTLVVSVAMIVRDREVFTEALHLTRLRALAQRYRRFATFSTPAAFLNVVASRIAILLLAILFGPAVVGHFGLAFGSLALPVGMVTAAVGQVFGVRAPVAHLEGRLGPLTEQVHARLVAVTLFPMAAVAIAGPELFAFVFGDDWREAGVYARLLSPWLFAMSVATPLTRLFDATERQRDDLLFSVALLAAQVVAIALASTGGSPRLAVAAVAVGGLISRLAQIGWMLHLGNASLSRALADIGRHALLAALLLLPACAAVVAALPILWVALALSLAGAAYAVAAIRLDGKTLRYAARGAGPMSPR